MTSHDIDYPDLVDEALRGVARMVLARVAEEGLPGDHHFFVTFSTHHPDLELSASLRDTYPDEMTIVLQNQFWDLVVEDEAFTVSVRFDGHSQRLRVPWRAIRSFVDPAAEFGLRFESAVGAADEPDPETESPAAPIEPAEVVSLDDFRKRDS